MDLDLPPPAERCDQKLISGILEALKFHDPRFRRIHPVRAAVPNEDCLVFGRTLYVSSRLDTPLQAASSR